MFIFRLELKNETRVSYFLIFTSSPFYRRSPLPKFQFSIFLHHINFKLVSLLTYSFIMNIINTNDNESTNEIVIHHFVRRIRRQMNWRKRAVGLNSVESNNIQHLRKFQKDCISSLNFIASSVVRLVHIISILSKMNEVLLYFILNIVTPGVTLKDKEDRNNSRFQISTFTVFFRKS